MILRKNLHYIAIANYEQTVNIKMIITLTSGAYNHYRKANKIDI